MQDPGLGQHDEGLGWAGFRAAQQSTGGADEISVVEQVLLAFGVGQHFGTGVIELQLQ